MLAIKLSNAFLLKMAYLDIDSCGFKPPIYCFISNVFFCSGIHQVTLRNVSKQFDINSYLPLIHLFTCIHISACTWIYAIVALFDDMRILIAM